MSTVWLTDKSITPSATYEVNTTVVSTYSEKLIRNNTVPSKSRFCVTVLRVVNTMRLPDRWRHGSSGGGGVRKLSMVCLHNNAIVVRGNLVTLLHCGTPELCLSAIYIVSFVGSSLPLSHNCFLSVEQIIRCYMTQRSILLCNDTDFDLHLVIEYIALTTAVPFNTDNPSAVSRSSQLKAALQNFPHYKVPLTFQYSWKRLRKRRSKNLIKFSQEYIAFVLLYVHCLKRIHSD